MFSILLSEGVMRLLASFPHIGLAMLLALSPGQWAAAARSCDRASSAAAGSAAIHAGHGAPAAQVQGDDATSVPIACKHFPDCCLDQGCGCAGCGQVLAVLNVRLQVFRSLDRTSPDGPSAAVHEFAAPPITPPPIGNP